MTVPGISNSDRILDSTPVTATSVFNIPWVVIADTEAAAVADFVVKVNGVAIDTSGASFAGNAVSGVSGIWNGGVLTLASPVTSQRVVIYSARDPRRTGNFLQGKPLPFNVLDTLQDDIVIQLRDNNLLAKRGIQQPVEDLIDNGPMELEPAATRRGKMAQFADDDAAALEGSSVTITYFESIRTDAEAARDEAEEFAAGVASARTLSFATLASAQANTVVGSAGQTAVVESRTSDADGYFGTFAFVPGDTTTTYPFNALGFVDALSQRWKRQWTANIVDLWYGVLADGLIASAASNTTAINQAIADAMGYGVPLFSPYRMLDRYVNEAGNSSSGPTADVYFFGEQTKWKRADGRTWQNPNATMFNVANNAATPGYAVRVKGIVLNGNYAGNRVRVGAVKLNGTAATIGEPLLGAISGATATYYEAGASYIGVDDYSTSFQNGETITGLTSGATWTQAWDLGVVNSVGFHVADTATDSTTGHTGTVLGVGVGWIALVGTTGLFTYNGNVTNGVVTTTANCQLYNSGGTSTTAAALSNRADVRTIADGNANQHAFGLNLSPQTVNGFGTVEVIDCTFNECIGTGYEPGGNSTQTYDKIIIENVRGDLNRRTRKTVSVTGQYNDLIVRSPLCDRLEIEINGVGVASTSFAFRSQIIGGHTRQTTLSLKDTTGSSGALPYPKPPCTVTGHVTDENFNSLYFSLNVTNSKLRTLSAWSIRDGELNMSDTDFIIGSTFNSSSVFSGTASGQPRKIRCENVRFQHETGAVLSGQWWSLSTPRAGDIYEWIDCTWSNIAPAVGHRGGDFNFDGNVFAWTGSNQIASTGATTTANVEHRMRLARNRPAVPGQAVVLWTPPVTAPTTGTFQSWDIFLDNPHWTPGYELAISDANTTVLFREGGTKLNVRNTSRWEASDRPTTSGQFYLKGQELINSLPKVNGYRGWRCTKSGDPTTRATFTAESAGPELRQSSNDNFMAVTIDTNRWALYRGTDTGNATLAANASPNTAGGVSILKSGKDAGGTVALNGSQAIDKQLWFMSQGGFSAIFRFKVDVVTACMIQCGLTNQTAALQEACTIGTTGSADTIASTPPNDFVAVTFDTGSFSQHFVGLGSKATVDTAILDLGAGPTAATAVTLQIDVDSSGTARFFLNGVYKGSLENAVTTSVGLSPFVLVSSKNTTQKTMTWDWAVIGAAIDQAA